tara:strand:- start:282 stop:725 length:444 start_codon:yes stop_codon:yes gene_type:complete
MRNILLVLGFFVLLTACNNGEKGTVSPAIDAEVVVFKAQGNPNEGLVQLSIEGMMCEVACAGKINKELRSMDGVSDVEVAYEDGRETDFAKVKYDPSKVQVEDIIQTLQTIADGGLYHVSKAEITKYEAEKKQTPNKAGSGDGVQLN